MSINLRVSNVNQGSAANISVAGLVAAFIIFLTMAVPLQGATPAQRVLEKLKESTPELEKVGDKPHLPTVAIVTTGGTIAEKTDPKTGGAVPAVSGSDLVEAVKGLDEIANIAVMNFCNIDSSQMEPAIWAELSKAVDKILEDSSIAGVVVTHGTDTMAEGAYMLDLTIKSDKPVVFTGAMNDASSLNPDGPANILHAVQQVCSPEAKGWGVTVTLDRYINSGEVVRKTQSTNPQTFMSGASGYLGYIFDGKVVRYNDRPFCQRLPLPEQLPKVVYIATYAGADGSLVRSAVDSGAKGLVVDGVGAGNVNEDTYNAILYALSKDVKVVMATRVYYGGFEPIYGDQGGGKTLVDQGCLMAPLQVTGPKSRILLILALGNYADQPEKLEKVFSRN
ncbi:MAG: asparaginase [Chlamydiota bacterium]